MSKNSEYVLKSQKRKKEYFVEMFGGKCQMCGYDKCINALDFHHLKDKKHSPSQIIYRKTKEVALEELKKCILLCANCHREVHYKEINLDISIETRKWFLIKCKTCNSEFQTLRDEQLYCSKRCNALDKQLVTRPSKEELQELLKSNTWSALGRKYGVSDNAVRKWAKKYNLPVGRQASQHRS